MMEYFLDTVIDEDLLFKIGMELKRTQEQFEERRKRVDHRIPFNYLQELFIVYQLKCKEHDLAHKKYTGIRKQVQGQIAARMNRSMETVHSRVKNVILHSTKEMIERSIAVKQPISFIMSGFKEWQTVNKPRHSTNACIPNSIAARRVTPEKDEQKEYQEHIQQILGSQHTDIDTDFKVKREEQEMEFDSGGRSRESSRVRRSMRLKEITLRRDALQVYSYQYGRNSNETVVGKISQSRGEEGSSKRVLRSQSRKNKSGEREINGGNLGEGQKMKKKLGKEQQEKDIQKCERKNREMRQMIKLLGEKEDKKKKFFQAVQSGINTQQHERWETEEELKIKMPISQEYFEESQSQENEIIPKTIQQQITYNTKKRGNYFNQLFSQNVPIQHSNDSMNNTRNKTFQSLNQINEEQYTFGDKFVVKKQNNENQLQIIKKYSNVNQQVQCPNEQKKQFQIDITLKKNDKQSCQQNNFIHNSIQTQFQNQNNEGLIQTNINYDETNEIKQNQFNMYTQNQSKKKKKQNQVQIKQQSSMGQASIQNIYQNQKNEQTERCQSQNQQQAKIVYENK